MIKDYQVNGMTCKGCQQHVRQSLESLHAVTAAEVELESGNVSLQLQEEIGLEALQEALGGPSSHYQIKAPGSFPGNENQPSAAAPVKAASYYCPMQCEGDKTYAKPGDCPVCGMDLVPVPGTEISDSGETDTLTRKLWIAIAFTLPIFLLSMSEMIPGNPLFQWLGRGTWNGIQGILSLPVVFYATRMFFRRAWNSVKFRNPNMFTLIGLGAGVAWVYSLFALIVPGWFPPEFRGPHGAVPVYFEAATVILTLVLLGQWMEARAHGKTREALEKLMDLAPPKAMRVKDGQTEEVPLEAVRLGDLLKVRPGEKVPVDGTITEGSSALDEAALTGEAEPVHKEAGDPVHSGSMNTHGSFLMRADKVGDETLLARIIAQVQEASRSRAPVQDLADRVAGIFVPIVVVVSLLTFTAWAIWGPEPSLAYALVNAIAVLIIACPCALGLATPMSVMVGVGRGASHGILVRNAEALQRLSEVDVLLTDKTGTLTQGTPSVDALHTLEAISEEELWPFMYGVNQDSEHPLAKATTNYLAEKIKTAPKVKDFRAIGGKGVEAQVNGKQVTLGNRSLMDEKGIAIPGNLASKAREERSGGGTVSFLAVEGEVKAILVLRDVVKPEAATVIRALKEEGLQVLLLTGDHELTAKAVAGDLEITSYQAGMLPEDKLDKVRSLQEQAKVVGMVGDGINDAPALAQSDVSIAMGTGTDIAMDSAGITLVKGDLQGILKARKLSKAVMRNIRQNLFFALLYNSLGVPIAAGLLYPFFGILLSPMIAALAMSFSSVSVIGNALRLRASKI